MYRDELLLFLGLPDSTGCTNILVLTLQAGNVQVTNVTEKVVIKGSAFQHFIYPAVLLRLFWPRFLCTDLEDTAYIQITMGSHTFHHRAQYSVVSFLEMPAKKKNKLNKFVQLFLCSKTSSFSFLTSYV